MREFLKRSALAIALLAAIALPAIVRAAPVDHTGVEHGTTPDAKPAGEKAVEKTHEKAGEPPERDLLNFQPAEAIWIVIIFAVLVAILYKTAWKNVLGGLKAREDRIRNDLDSAEKAKRDAAASLASFNAQLATAREEGNALIQKATVDAERIAAQIKSQAQADADAARDRAAKDIDAAKRQAIQDIYVQAASISTAIAEKILRRNLNADDQRDLVKHSLEQMQGVN